MYILIDSGSYHCLNVGDIAMLQAGVERLRQLWPDASIAAVTNTPDALAWHCPDIDPVPLQGRVAFVSDRFFGRADRALPRVLRDKLTGLENRIRREWPAGLGSLIAVKRALAFRRDYAAPRTYIDALQRADLVVVTGAGVFTDAFTENALGVLATLELALRQHARTALMGQGIGPVANVELRRRMAEVLPRVDLIALREGRESLRLLGSLGVSSDRIVVTGDDAIEMANRRVPRELGDAIGVNVRLAPYAGTGPRAIDVIRPALERAVARLRAPLAAVPIAHSPDCHDGVAIRELVRGNGADAQVVELNTPLNAIDEVSRCRIVVAGSYHAAVFALAQGIPVVGVVATPYYVNKFSGLAELFPGGCEIVSLDHPDATDRLGAAIDAAWTNAPGLREQLLRAAEAQIERGRHAYQRLGLSLGSRRDLVHHAISPSEPSVCR